MLGSNSYDDRGYRNYRNMPLDPSADQQGCLQQGLAWNFARENLMQPIVQAFSPSTLQFHSIQIGIIESQKFNE